LIVRNDERGCLMLQAAPHDLGRIDTGLRQGARNSSSNAMSAFCASRYIGARSRTAPGASTGAPRPGTAGPAPGASSYMSAKRGGTATCSR
jgi:hypothetical protein